VGRLTPYKGCHLLLEAMAGLGDVRGLRLTVVGDGPQREELEAMARESGIADRVRFTGWVAQERTREYYEAADLFVFPSVREFGGAVVLEAMAAGLPCVVADHGGIGEYVTPESGVAVRPLSPEQMAGDVVRAVRGLVRDRERWRRLSAGAAARARRYAWETKAAGLAGIYAGLADPGAGP
jgi:glycosyltransferase involved in cell wall biosynthesis